MQELPVIPEKVLSPRQNNTTPNKFSTMASKLPADEALFRFEKNL
jgi:hypothetical protein